MRATALLTPPLAWFVLIYLASLGVLLITSFWRINEFTTNIERVWGLDQLPADPQQPGLPDDHRAHHRDGRRRDDRRRADRFPVRVLHGAGGVASHPHDAVRGRAPAAVGELPGPRVRVGADPQPRRASSTGPWTSSGWVRSASCTRTPPCSSCSATSGCRSWSSPCTRHWSGSRRRTSRRRPTLGAGVAHAAERGRAARDPRLGGRLDLHVLAHARRLHQQPRSPAAPARR